MSNIDKQAVQAVADLKAGYTLCNSDVAILNELARIALASLEAEPVAYIRSAHNPDGFCFADGIHPTHLHQRLPLSTLQDGCYWKVTPLYTAPPAPVSVPAAMEMDDDFDSAFEHGKAVGWNAYRAAMLQSFGNSEQLNSPVIPDGLRLALSNAGIAAPESDEMMAATCEKHIQALVTWVKERKPFRSAVIPDGWAMVPIEPTEDMIVNGFESEPDESFSDEKEWEAYDAMSGCQQAAHRAKLCWAAMVHAAPRYDANKN